jgi:hypothetical protein
VVAGQQYVIVANEATPHSGAWATALMVNILSYL